MTAGTLDRTDRPVMLDAEGRATVSARAVAAATRVAERHGIRVTDPVVLAERYAVRVHLRPAPLVARVSTFTARLRRPVDAWLARELDVTRFLAGRGAPVVPPSDLLPAGPHEEDGFALSFWSYVAPISDELAPSEVVVRMIAELHDALRDYPGELPFLGPPLNDIPRSLGRLEQLPEVIAASDLAMLRRLADRLLGAVDPANGPAQPLHGDAHALNLIRSARGLLWNDFEDVCQGPVAWDLTNLPDHEIDALAAYPEAPSAETVAAFRNVRLLHGTLWVLALQPEVDEWAAHARGMLDALRALG